MRHIVAQVTVILLWRFLVVSGRS